MPHEHDGVPLLKPEDVPPVVAAGIPRKHDGLDLYADKGGLYIVIC